MIERVRVPLGAAALGGLYLLATTTGPLSVQWGSRFPIALLAAGLATGALFRWGPHWWPVAAIAATLAELMLGAGVATATAQGLAGASGALASALILKRIGFGGDFGQPRAAGRFAIGVGLGALATTLAHAVATAVHTGAIDPAYAVPPSRRWLDTTLSLLLVMPIVVSADRRTLRRRVAGRAEVAVWLALLVAMLVTVLRLPPQYIGIPAFGGILVALAWAVMRMNLHYALAAACAGALTTAASAGFQWGLLADDPLLRAQRLAWNAGFLFSLAALALNAFLSAHERAERRSRTLFRESPEPAWLTDPATGRFLEVNAAAIATYGYDADEFARLRVTDVVAQSEGGADALGDGTHEAHRRSDGRLLRMYVRRRELRLDDRVAQLWFNVDVTERTELRSALRRAAAEERERVGRELHDGLGQELTGIAFVLGGMATQVRRGTPVTAEELARVADFARGALESCRRIVSGMSPVDVGATLPQALQAMVARLDGGTAHISLVVDPDDRVRDDTPGFVAEQLLRICQEALANALRHSGAHRIDVHLRRTVHGVTVAIRDDGCGFDPAAVELGMGLRTLRLRAEEIGAVLTVDAAPGRGVCVECRYLGEAAVA